jgi:predicted enzyme related to lactoylglutathione lyase
MPGELVHFDIPVDDIEKAVDFYRDVMGWKIEKYEGEGMEGMVYWEVNPNPDKEDIIQGGIGKKMMPGQTIINYYNAEGGLEAFNKRVRDKGGTVMMEKMPIAGWGWFSVCMDPEGNPFAGWEDDKSAK